jgi:hypothetical protein
VGVVQPSINPMGFRRSGGFLFFDFLSRSGWVFFFFPSDCYGPNLFMRERMH